MNLEKESRLVQLREEWESGLTVLVTMDQRVTHHRVLVILQGKDGSYHLHRYLSLGQSGWDVSVDGQSVQIGSVWRWLNEPKALPRQ